MHAEPFQRLRSPQSLRATLTPPTWQFMLARCKLWLLNECVHAGQEQQGSMDPLRLLRCLVGRPRLLVSFASI